MATTTVCFRCSLLARLLSFILDHGRGHGHPSPPHRGPYPPPSYGSNRRAPPDPHTLEYPASLKQYAEWFRYFYPQDAADEDVDAVDVSSLSALSHTDEGEASGQHRGAGYTGNGSGEEDGMDGSGEDFDQEGDDAASDEEEGDEEDAVCESTRCTQGYTSI